jgi:hypothetical protein
VSAGACVTSVLAGVSYFTIPLNYTPTAVGADVVQVAIQDIFGDSSGTFSIYIHVTSSLTANSAGLQASAGTPAPLATLCVLQSDALNGQSAITLSVSATSTNAGGSVSVQPDTTGSICGSTPYTGQPYLQYQAPNGYVGADSIQYAIQASGGQSSSNTVNVTVNGTIDFATQIKPNLESGGCAGCHGIVTSGFTQFLPVPGSTVLQFYSAICGTTSGGPCQQVALPVPATIPLVTVSIPTSSALYVLPNLPTPPTPMPSSNGTTWISDVKTWINEGAYCTTSGTACQ